MSRTRPERAAALEAWADTVDESDLIVVDTDVSKLSTSTHSSANVATPHEPTPSSRGAGA